MKACDFFLLHCVEQLGYAVACKLSQFPKVQGHIFKCCGLNLIFI